MSAAAVSYIKGLSNLQIQRYLGVNMGDAIVFLKNNQICIRLYGNIISNASYHITSKIVDKVTLVICVAISTTEIYFKLFSFEIHEL